MMPYTYPSRTCSAHGCLFEKQPYVGNGEFCFKHGGELEELTDEELQQELEAQEYEERIGGGEING
jgi:hypothetical protein